MTEKIESGFWSAKQTSEYLNIHLVTLYRNLKAGLIPGKKVGGTWRFKQVDLDKWFDKK